MKEKAIQWLREHGVTDLDFETFNVVKYADNLSQELEIARRIKELDEAREFTSFEGDEHCADSCSGWDGTDRRCDCGNRRVAWMTTDSHTFENPSVRAEAW